MSYIALIHQNAGTCSVRFPDFPTFTATAPSMSEARTRAAEVLADHIEELRGQRLPAPSKLEMVMADPRNQDGVAFMIEAP
jgi:predicted RNase H-like HicB family nuclease